jgi:hypothetical protein
MANVASLLSQLLTPSKVQTASPVVSKPVNSYNNNPFVNYNGYQYNSETYAKNKPVKGGYFAGYYNGKQNIVGRRLFVEV